YLREGVHLRAMAQKDPLVVYTTEGEAMFRELGLAIREEVVRTLFHAEIEIDEGGGDPFGPESPTSQNGDPGGLMYQHESLAGSDVIAAAGAGAGVTAGALDAGGGSAATHQHGSVRPSFSRSATTSRCVATESR